MAEYLKEARALCVILLVDEMEAFFAQECAKVGVEVSITTRTGESLTTPTQFRKVKNNLYMRRMGIVTFLYRMRDAGDVEAGKLASSITKGAVTVQNSVIGMMPKGNDPALDRVAVNRFKKNYAEFKVKFLKSADLTDADQYYRHQRVVAEEKKKEEGEEEEQPTTDGEATLAPWTD